MYLTCTFSFKNSARGDNVIVKCCEQALADDAIKIFKWFKTYSWGLGWKSILNTRQLSSCFKWSPDLEAVKIIWILNTRLFGIQINPNFWHSFWIRNLRHNVNFIFLCRFLLFPILIILHIFFLYWPMTTEQEISTVRRAFSKFFEVHLNILMIYLALTAIFTLTCLKQLCFPLCYKTSYHLSSQ